MGDRSRLGRYMLVPSLSGPTHRKQRIVLFSVLTGLLVFILCIPAIVVPLRHHRHSSSLSSSSGSSTNPTSSITVIAPAITPTSFTPFSVPSDIAIPGVFIATDPSDPPTVDEAPGLGGVLPDFAQAWQKAKAKAVAHLSNFTLDDKVALTTGVGWMVGRCVGNIPPVKDFPGLCLEVRPRLEFWREVLTFSCEGCAARCSICRLRYRFSHRCNHCFNVRITR